MGKKPFDKPPPARLGYPDYDPGEWRPVDVPFQEGLTRFGSFGTRTVRETCSSWLGRLGGLRAGQGPATEIRLSTRFESDIHHIRSFGKTSWSWCQPRQARKDTAKKEAEEERRVGL